MKNRNKKFLLIICCIALLIGVGYAALSATLNINGQTTINKATWDIHMEDVNVTSGSVTAQTPATIDSSKTTVNFSVQLTNPGDFYEFTVKEVNKGTIDAMIAVISNTQLTDTQSKYLDYTVTYDKGTELSEKQLLAANSNAILKIKVKFKENISSSDLPTTGEVLNLKFSIIYQQADNSAIPVSSPICKRATTLHTENSITYGNLGTKGVLASGDAFDCDVNGDGVYDSATERFYYVSGKDGNDSSEDATLVYYSNVSGGVASNTKAVEYTNDENEYSGPSSAIKQLPTTAQWQNVKLSNTTRNIKDEKGTVRINNFSYIGYAARLLNVQEINKACGITISEGATKAGDLDSCKYLLENTQSSSYMWLESPSSSSFIDAWMIKPSDRQATTTYVATSCHIRPVIEVQKTKISY